MGSRAAAGARAGSLGVNGYRYITVDGVHYLEHQLIWFHVHGVWAPELDHENLKRDNNWIDNIRVATRSQNNANSSVHSNNKLGVKGVFFLKRRKKFLAQIGMGSKTFYLGLFETPEEAGAAYAEAANRIFGEFART